MIRVAEAYGELTSKVTPSFVEKHVVEIAFAVATVALFILVPLELFLGAALGFAIHYFSEPDLQLKNEPVISLANTVFSIVGAVAALIRLTPAGAAGGFIFKAIPFAASLTVGSTAYRATKQTLV